MFYLKKLSILIFLLFINSSLVRAFTCNKDEISLDNWCYKLTNISLSNDLKMCESLASLATSVEFFACLNDLLNKLFQIYTDNSFLDENYEFTFLDVSNSNSILRKLVQTYLKFQNVSPNTTYINIFFNYFSHNFHGYIENQPKNDEMPNLMMHPEEDLKNLTEVCVIGQQIQSNNESFKFKYSECNKIYPFICIKPLRKFKSKSFIHDRCLPFKENLPGGNWVECDKLLDGLISESQKCCMYNINLNENFANSNQFCARFDSQIFSSKIIGYKSILEYYASYLNVNYRKNNKQNMDYSNFWTSCKSHGITNDHSITCLENLDPELKESKAFDFPVNSASLKLLSLKMSTSSSNSSFIVYNLTNIFRLIKIILPNKKFDLELFSLNKKLEYNECEIILNTPNQTSESHVLLECMSTFFDFVIKSSVFLVRRSLKVGQLELNMTRSRTSHKTKNNQCFSFYQTDKLILLSLPFLNKCYHFSMIYLKNESAFNLSLLNSFYLQSVFFPQLLSNVSFSNSDLPLKEIKIEFLYNILNSLGITEVNCDLFLNNSASKEFRLFATKKIISDDDDEMPKKLVPCTKSSSSVMFLNISGIDKFNKNTNGWMTNFTDFLKQPNVLLLLHSFSFYKKVLNLNCFDSFFKIKNEIDKCFRFYSEKFCIFKCPSHCNYNKNEDGIVWQYERFYYLSVSSICQAAFHSNIFSNHTKVHESVFFKKNKNYFKIDFISINQTIIHSNGISTQLWPPSGLINYKKIPMNYEIFHFRVNSNINQNFKAQKNELLSLDCLILIKAVHFLNSKKLTLNSVNIQIYIYEEYNEFDYEIDFIRLIPNEENFASFSYWMKSIISNKTYLKISQELYRIDFNITINNFDYLKMLNNYFELILVNNSTLSRGTIKFPVNFISNYMALSTYQTIRLNKTQTEYISLKNKIDHECTWFLLNIDLEIPCNINLSLKYDSQIKDQNFIAYPNFHKTNIFAYTRVLLDDKDESVLRCKNGGVFEASNLKCTCLPGLHGNFCEKACPKGLFGKSCEIKCPEKECHGYLICSKEPLGCSCAPGYSGFACDQPCPSNRWGPECRFNCEYCSNKICDRFNGDCLCSNNFRGIYCDQCKEGFYGKNCSDECEKNCLVCSKLDGSCILSKKIETTMLVSNAEEFSTSSYSFSTKSQYFSESKNSYLYTFNFSSKVFDNFTKEFSKTSIKTIQNQTSINTVIPKDNCERGYWKHGLVCQKCGMCKNEICDSKNGKCDENLCKNEQLEPPFCNKCIQTYTNYPDCDLKLCSLNCSCFEPNDNILCNNIINKNNNQNEFSSNIIISWLVALFLVLCIGVILNYSFSRKIYVVNYFNYDLELNSAFSNKTTFKRSDLD